MPDEPHTEAGARQPAGAHRWSVVIADDEPLARLRLRTLLDRHPAFEIVAECADGGEVLDALQVERADVLFLDVRMPELDGVAVGEALAADAEAGEAVPSLVFVTAYDAHAVRAFDLGAIDYLVKPVDIDRFDRAIARLQARLSAPGAAGEPAGGEELRAALKALAELRPRPRFPTRFPIRDARGVYFVATNDIDRVDAEGNYVALVTAGRRHLLRDSMRAIEAKLDPERFVRVHRSAIVAIDRIRRIEPWGHGEYVITMSDGTKLTSSRTHGERVQELMR